MVEVKRVQGENRAIYDTLLWGETPMIAGELMRGLVEQWSEKEHQPVSDPGSPLERP